MGFNGSGLYVRNNGFNSGANTWQSDKDALVDILASRHDNHDQDMATGLSNCICKDGQTTITADLPMSGFKLTGVANSLARNQYAATGQVQDNAFAYGGTSGGSANAQTITPTPAITAYAAGQLFWVIAGFSNTGATTLGVSGLSATAVVKGSGNAALTGGEIVAGGHYIFLYDAGGGGRFKLINPALEDQVLNNNTFLTARNAAGSGVLDLLKADGSDNTILNAKTGGAIGLAINGTSQWFMSATSLFPVGNGTEDLGGASNVIANGYVTNLKSTTLLESLSGSDMVIGTPSAHAINFKINGSNKLSINSTGTLVPAAGVGTNTLNIGGTGNIFATMFAGIVQSDTASATALRLLASNAAGGISVETGNAARWAFNSSGHQIPNATNTYDIGSSSVLLRALYATTISGPAFASWTPTLTGSGSMTVSGSIVYSKYFQIGKMVFLSIWVNFITLGGTASTDIEFTLPVTAASTTAGVNLGGGTIIDSAVTVGVIGFSTTAKAKVNRFDLANWALGSNREFRMTATYEAA